VITRRNVNPGDNVQVGQGLMAIRSLDEIWVDANFKETQLDDLRIGQPVDLYVDMYGGGSRRVPDKLGHPPRIVSDANDPWRTSSRRGSLGLALAFQ
jgi:hypothetical protein